MQWAVYSVSRVAFHAFQSRLKPGLMGYVCPSCSPLSPPYLSSTNILQSTFGHLFSFTAVGLLAFLVNQSSLQLVSYTDFFQLSANAYFFPQLSLTSILSDPIPDFCSISA